MKKVVRTVWISLLSGLAFLTACTCTKGLSRAERKQLKEERSALLEAYQQKEQEAASYTNPDRMMTAKRSELEILQRLDQINTLLGDEKANLENASQMNKVNTQIDSLQQVIDAIPIQPCVYGPPVDDPGYQQYIKDQQRSALTRQLDMLNRAIEQREGACVYGSPEVIQRYEEETQELRRQRDEVSKQLKELDNE